VKASETIAIDTFCDAAQIPSMYYEKPYYLAPAKGGDKVYALLRQALDATHKAAVATFVMHQRQHLCAIAPRRFNADVADAALCRGDAPR
jgi:DNA end-binding protein Ku